MSGQNLELIWK